MLQIDYKSGISICDQVINGFINLISLSVLKTDDAMPSVRALASKLSVNPNTIQKAYAILEERGVIYSVKGKGSFVADAESTRKTLIDTEKGNLKTAILSALQKGVSLKDINNIINEINSEGGDLN